MRRTATLSLFAEEKENNLANVDHLFSINKKCTIELGIVNKVPKYNFKIQNQDDSISSYTINYQEQYGNIVWFPLGMYVMFNPSIAHSMQGVTISMQLKDKMCLLNGDLGGQIHSAIDFGYQDQMVDINAVSIEKNPVLIYNIIKELVNHWGNEQLHKIIISQVPLQIKMAVKWLGENPVWIIKQGESIKLTTTEPEDGVIIIKGPIERGYDVGFIYEDFTYPGQLVCNAGDTVTSVLDKLIGVMGNYQYFYDVFGNFIFQEKQNYLNMTNTAYWLKQQPDKVGNLPSDAYKVQTRLTKSVYDFTNNKFTINYNNTLNYNNIKNDFVVWGSYPTTNSNVRIPCRFHLAIDKKPQIYQWHNNIMFYKDDNQVVRGIALGSQKLFSDKEIYCYSYSELGFSTVKAATSFEQAINNWNQFITSFYELPIDEQQLFMKQNKYCLIKIKDKYYTSNYHYLKNITNSQQFIQINILKQNQQTKEITAFTFLPWYYNGATAQIKKENNIITEIIPGSINTTYFPKTLVEIRPAYSTDWREQIYYQMLESEKLGTDENTEINNSYFQYYAELKEEFPKIFDLETQEYKIDMAEHPDQINYYLDFIDENSELGQYSVNNIGRRAKIIGDNNEGINCVFEPEIPDIVYIDVTKYNTKQEVEAIQKRLTDIGQQWTQIDPQFSSLFSVGGSLNSCYEKIKDLLYQYTNMNNPISISCLPIYYLEPNTRITVEDQPSGIYGDYIIQSISLPLDVSSTMSINAYKALQKI